MLFSLRSKLTSKTEPLSPSSNSPKRRWLRVLTFLIVLVLLAGLAVFFKVGSVLDKISLGDDNLFQGLVKSLPGVEQQLQGEKDGKINILVLGMRGENIPGGGLLTDTIMVFSIHPSTGEGDQARASIVSIPRDLQVKLPGKEERRKINAVYALGEEREKGKGGLEDVRTVMSEVTGLTIPYVATVNFQGFTDLVNALGGVTVTLDAPFEEAIQFREPQVCDPYVFTVPTKPAQFQYKYHTRQDGTRYVAKAYPLCYNPDLECGGDFKLPAGVNELDGEKALCFARARYQTNDFERAKRQQQVIQAVKEKALSAGTLTDFGKITAILESLGNNVTTNFEVWEMKRLFEIYGKNTALTLTQRVLDNSESGLLYAPEQTKESGYILLPRGNSYDQIHALFQSLP